MRKNELKVLTDEFMNELFKLCESNIDIFNTSDSNVFEFILSDTNEVLNNKYININNLTPIISFHNKNQKVENIYENIKKYNFKENTLKASDCFILIQSLNLITINGGATHRLSAIYKYVNEIQQLNLNSDCFVLKKINIPLLSKIKIDSKNKVVTYVDINGIKYLYFLKTSQMLNIIKYLQIHFIGHINELTLIEKFKLKYIYIFDEYIHVQINIFKNVDVAYDEYNKQVPFLTKIYFKFFKNFF